MKVLVKLYFIHIMCNTFEDPMARLCVPNIIKNVNMKVYNFLMRLNETRNVCGMKVVNACVD